MSLADLTAALLNFRDERNWAQFHSLRNLIVSLNLEAAELLELIQWKNDEDMASLLDEPGKLDVLSEECADVLLYLLLIANKAGIDLEEVAKAKLTKNAQKYPVEKSFGKSIKYTDLPKL